MSLDRSPVRDRLRHRDNYVTFTFISSGNLELPIYLSCMSLDCGGELEYQAEPEQSPHRKTGIEARTLLPWENSTSHLTTVPPIEKIMSTYFKTCQERNFWAIFQRISSGSAFLKTVIFKNCFRPVSKTTLPPSPSHSFPSSPPLLSWALIRFHVALLTGHSI